ncbi:MAG: FHA domain-containing protein [Thermoflexales bacterium]|nr:FHA domain-containing protein [Thermoflexales bacterium]
MSFGKLEIKYADGTSGVVELTKPQMIMGRSADVEIPLNDQQVSRRHAALLCGPDGVRLVDAGSANGTFLSGARLPAQQPVPLSDGAQIRVGQTLIKFVAPVVEVDKTTTPVRMRAAAPKPEAVEAKADETSIKRKPATTTPPEAKIPVAPPPSFTPPPPSDAEAEPAPEPQRPITPPGMPTDQSSYLKYLPSFLGGNEFLGRFLLIFEQILTPLDRQIDQLYQYFDPRLAPPDFLPWLASWLGLVLDERWPEGQRRELIRAAVELYEWRGTRRGLSEFVRLYTGFTPVIIEPGVGKGAKADQAHRFIVRITSSEPDKLDRAVLMSIIDLEKPAHAGYKLEVVRDA